MELGLSSTSPVVCDLALSLKYFHSKYAVIYGIFSGFSALSSFLYAATAWDPKAF